VLDRVVHQFNTTPANRLSFNLDQVFSPGYDANQRTDLFSVYPELKGVKVTFDRGGDGSLGEFNPITGNIGISITPNRNLSDSVRSTLLHEIQHWVQNREGWAGTGMNTSFLSPDNPNGLWKGLLPNKNPNGGFASDFDANLHDLVSSARGYGDLFWQRAMLEEYQLEPDRVYQSVISNVPANSRNNVEATIVSHYLAEQEDNSPSVRSTGWETASTNPYMDGDLEDLLKALEADTEYESQSITSAAQNMGMDSEDIQDFIDLGLISSTEDFNSYMSEVGEIQARNTETRSSLSGNQRLSTFPSSTEYSRQGPWIQPEIMAPRERAINTIIRLSQGAKP
jgi:hypothetical protein